MSQSNSASCSNASYGVSAQALATGSDLKAKVEVSAAGSGSLTSNFWGDFLASAQVSESVFVRPNDTQYTGANGFLSFAFTLDGTMSGDVGNRMQFGMEKLVPCGPQFPGCWTTATVGSLTSTVASYDADGDVVATHSGPGTRLLIWAPGSDVYVDGTVVFTFPVTFNSYSTFTRYLSVEAGAPGAKVDFFNTGTLTNVQALDSAGRVISADLLTATGSYGGVTAAVPEPSSWAMMLLGFAAIGWSTRRRARPLTLRA
jgi:hypothetical protein